MKMFQLAIISVCIAALSGCRMDQTVRKSDGAPKVSALEDRYEVLIRHLQRRISSMADEIGERDNKRMEEEIALLKGQRVHHQDQLLSGLHRMPQDLLDAEDFIEEHNRRHPEHSFADVKELARDLCGDCAKERAFRDSQLKEEAHRR
jgi:hypothetical protein